jgi:hypothetical protein
MNRCTNCAKLVHRGKLCDECKDRSIYDKLLCVVCTKMSDVRKMKTDICFTCQQTNSFRRCDACDEKSIIDSRHNICKQCTKILCRCCIDSNTSNRYSWMFGDIICSKCTVEKDYICQTVHSLCLNQKHICCVCKDNRYYRRDPCTYEGYLDTVGITNTLKRWEHYCPSCKQNCEKMYIEYIEHIK